jgi:hypothetical protein
MGGVKPKPLEKVHRTFWPASAEQEKGPEGPLSRDMPKLRALRA